MGLFSDVQMDDDVNEASEGVGGGGFLVDSGVYECTIEEAYGEIKKTGSRFINFILKTSTGATVRSGQCWMSGNAKGNKIHYEKDGEKYPLPGYTVCENICLLAADTSLLDMDVKTRTISLYDFDAKAEVDTEVESLDALRGKKVQLGIIKTFEDKNKQGDDGEWYPVGTKEGNEIDRVFAAIAGYEGMTAKEIQAGAEEPTIKPKWLAKWEGQVKDTASDEAKAAQADGGSEPASKPAAAAEGKKAAPKKSLFNK